MATQFISEQPREGIPVEEYLSTVYEPDREYDNGIVVERNLGEFEHALLQTLLATLFTNNMESWRVFALTEQRVHINQRRFLVPDVCVLRRGSPREAVLTHPPLIVVEIMSPEDTVRRAASKAMQYLEFGVEHVWIIDPTARVAYRGTRLGLELVSSGELAVESTPVVIRIGELFAQLDRM